MLDCNGCAYWSDQREFCKKGLERITCDSYSKTVAPPWPYVNQVLHGCSIEFDRVFNGWKIVHLTTGERHWCQRHTDAVMMAMMFNGVNNG